MSRAGLPEDQAMEIANQVYSAKVNLHREASNKNTLQGGMMLALGVAIVGISFVVPLPGGVVIMPVGLIFAGAIWLFKGLR